MSDFGVVVPAFLGARTVHRSLESLSRQRFDGSLHVVVAVNDSRNDTLQAARAYASAGAASRFKIEIIVSAQGRRSAIAAAEELLPTGPRLYLDQDAALSADAIQRLAEALHPVGRWHFAAPRLLCPTTGSHATRAYCRAWSRLPYVTNSPVTVGAYAVSAAGRERWTALPDLHSDDKFVRLQFAVHERTVVTSATYEVLHPQGLSDLVRARRRYDRGNHELLDHFGVCADQDRARHEDLVPIVLRSPRLWPSYAVLATVHGLAWVGELVRPGARA